MKKDTFWIRACIAVLIFAGFIAAVVRLDDGQQQKGKEQLETALRRAAVACYAAEGSYPPNLEYMQENYGIRYDGARYKVIYDVFASNLMPDITVLDVKR